MPKAVDYFECNLSVSCKANQSETLKKNTHIYKGVYVIQIQTTLDLDRV